MRLIVGLGNPGAEYAATRHNAGFWWLDRIADQAGLSWRQEQRFQGEVARWSLQGQDVWLLKPATFMNLSGQSARALAHYYKIAVPEILVVHDELDLPPGVARLKQGGGHGGHNGLKSLIAQLGSADFWRLRLGIGHPGDRNRVVDFVLHAPSRAEDELIEAAQLRALAVLQQMVHKEMNLAMQQLHRTN